MNIIDIIHPIFEFLLTFILISLLLFGWRTINSYWSKQKTKKEQTNFKKANVEYKDPPRPLSKKFYGFFQLALMTTRHRQEQLTRTFSNSIKEYLELKPQLGNVKFSSNFNLLINDPNLWLQRQYDIISSSTKSQKKKSSPDFLYEEYVKILVELEELMDIQLLCPAE
ncbi:MAG: hypothetical protein ACFE9L_06230 [Candidatus Hodarchaeota archaeon]